MDPSTGSLTPLSGSPYAINAFGAALSPSGLFGWFAGGFNNDVLAYAFDPNTGALTAVPGSAAAAGSIPVGLAVNNTGQFVYASNNASNTVSGYSINANTGALTALASSPFGAGAIPNGIAIAVVNSRTYDASQGTLPGFQGWAYGGDNGNATPTVMGPALMENTTAGGQYWNRTDPSIDLSQYLELVAV